VAAAALTAGLPESLLRPTLNVYRLALHPDGLSGRILDFPDLAAYLVLQLRHSAVVTGDPALEALLQEVLAYPNIAHIRPLLDVAGWSDPPLLVPFRIATPLGELSLFTTLTTFGTALDVTLSELVVELFYPADDRSAELLRSLAAAGATGSER
jgi:hypothetical protein